MTAVHASSVPVLRRASSQWDVARYRVKNWGISREYEIEVTLHHAMDCPRVSEMVCLQIDHDYCFYGVISTLHEAYSDQWHEIQFKLLSPLRFYLNHHHVRVYSGQTLEGVIQTILTDAGLKEQDDFELRLASSSEQIWLYQDNEPTFNFLQRIFSEYGLFYGYQQTPRGVLCVITDNLSSLLPDESLSLKLAPATGFHQKQFVSDAAAVHQLCSRSISTQSYQLETVDCRIDAFHSEHAFALGGLQVKEGYGAKRAEVQQALLDEHACQVELTLSVLEAFPGQAVTLDPTVLGEKKYNICSIEILGVHERHLSSKSSHEETRLHHERLQVNMRLSTHFCGFPRVAEETSRGGGSHFCTAQVEHHHGLYPELSDQGAYRIRLHQDETPGSERPFTASSKAEGSPWVRSALYFAGNHYGFSCPLHDASEVLIGFENGCSHRPVILGAFSNLSNPSVVNEKNQTDHLMRTRAGNQFNVSETQDERCLELSTVDSGNYLNLKQTPQEARFQLCSTEGRMQLNALKMMDFVTDDQYNQQARGEQAIWVNGTCCLKSHRESVYLSSKESMSAHQQDKVEYLSKEQAWVAQKKVHLKAEQQLDLNAKHSLILCCSSGNQVWQARQGKIVMTARYALLLQSAQSSMALTPDAIKLQTDKNLNLNAGTVSGLID